MRSVRSIFVVSDFLLAVVVWRSLSVDVFYLLYESSGGTPFDVVGHNFFAMRKKFGDGRLDVVLFFRAFELAQKALNYPRFPTSPPSAPLIE